MNFQRLSYTTTLPSLVMDFVFMEVGGEEGWRIYIINKIDYKGRKTDGHSTHRSHFEGDTYKCICWLGKINTLEEAKAIASFWADVTVLYITNRSGKSFDEIADELMQSLA